MKLVTPNTSPKKAPVFSPKVIAPTATGTIIKVILTGPSGRYPSGVNAISIIIAESIAFSVSAIIFFRLTFLFFAIWYIIGLAGE